MVAPKLRVAEPQDQAALDDIKRGASLVADAYREALLAHPEFLVIPSDRVLAGHVMVAEDDEQILGLVMIGRRDDGLELDGLFVRPGLWKRGIGRFLVEGAAAHFGDVRAQVLHVVASPDAEPFYAACGFAVTGSCDTRFGPAIAMVRGEAVR